MSSGGLYAIAFAIYLSTMVHMCTDNSGSQARATDRLADAVGRLQLRCPP